MAIRKPFRLDGEGNQTFPRDTQGRFARPNAVPANPLAEQRPAANDQQVMSGWAPTIGQGSAETSGQSKPYQPISSPSKGFRVS